MRFENRTWQATNSRATLPELDFIPTRTRRAKDLPKKMSTPKRISPRLEKLRAKTKVENPDKATTSATKTNKRKALGPPSTGEIIGRTKGLSAYEIKRLENIARNKQVLANLGLSGAKRELSQAITTKKPRIATLGVQRVKRAARKRKPKLPPRRSLRGQGKDADGKGIAAEFQGAKQTWRGWL